MSFGQLSPNAAIELGQNNFFIFFYLATYKQLNNDFMFISSVFIGFSYPVADNKADKQ